MIKFGESWRCNIFYKSYIAYIIYLISRVESNKFDNTYNKIRGIFFGPNFSKIEHALFHQINLTKITSAMALAYLNILPRALIWLFLTVEIISSTYFIFFTYNVSLADSLVLISLCILVIVGEHIIQRWKKQCSKFSSMWKSR